MSKVGPIHKPSGLSPLARGTRRQPLAWGRYFRFIPAGAGNTMVLASSHVPAPVYPRWRGEHVSASGIRFVISGLSPLARGTLLGAAQYPGARRFIPAGAGNTRTCGAGWYPVAGLSPLARGTPKCCLMQSRRRRFIPAGAGNTTGVFLVIKQPAVYPRWRGEHPLSYKPVREVHGLSPLARGTHYLCADLVYWRRFIPAGAGNTTFATSADA